MTDTFAARTAALKEKFDEPLPESWVPENAGDEIVGTFVRLDKGTTAFGPSWIVVLETEKGDHRSVWLYHSSLANEMKRARPVPGELVGVRYEGKKAVANPTPGKKPTYHAYRVVVDRAQVDVTPDWGAVGDADPVDEVPAVDAPQDDEEIPF